MNTCTLPLVAIIGRPNVGKSTLFNAIVGHRRAIVGDEPGITRDRLYQEASWKGRHFRLVDTGGIIPDDRDLIPREILNQARQAIEEADTVVFVGDAQNGVHPLDADILRIVLTSGKRFFVVANKADSPKADNGALPFYSLGADAVYPISAEHRRGLDELLEELTWGFPEITKSGEPALPEIRVAIIGRPNVGKSSLTNALLGEERMIVSDIPGTTRDSIDALMEMDGTRYRLIDTAGIRRKGKTHEMAEKLSVIQARKHLAEADLALLLLDPAEGVTHMDAVIAGYALESGKAIMVVVNKLDLLPSRPGLQEEIRESVHRSLKFLDYAPVLFVSAKERKNLHTLFPHLKRAFEGRNQRIPTAELNRCFRDMLTKRAVGSLSQAELGVKYLTQVKISPPSFALFLKKGQSLHFSERRFVINQLRERFGFYANPIYLYEKH